MVRKHIHGIAVLLLAGVATAQPQQMNLVISPADAMTCGHNYSHASAWVITFEQGDSTGVLFRFSGAKPNQLHTIWLRLAAPSPISAAPATAAAATWGIQTIINNAGTASAAGAHAFYTNRSGDAWVFIPLNFGLSNGIYPFGLYQGDLPNVAIGNTPFTFRVVSHCTDGLQHGLSPGVNEPTFDISLP